MRGVTILATIIIGVVAALAAASGNVSLILQPSVMTGGSSSAAIASAGPPCTPPSSVCDVDGDNKTDLAVANYDSDDVSVLWGNGDGTFPPAATAQVDAASTGSTALMLQTVPAGFPLSGSITLIGSQAVHIGFTRSENTLTLVSPIPLDVSAGTTITVVTVLSVGTNPDGESPVAIAIADADGDGNLDIITANESADTVTVLLNQGSRTFAAAKESPTGSSDIAMSPEAIAVGDFNGDGKLDAVTANSLDDSVSVLRGEGDGTFSILSVLPVGSEPYGVVAVDLNNDGILDLVVANSSGGDDESGSLTVYKGLGNGGKGNGAFECVAGTDDSCSAPEITSWTFYYPTSITAAHLNDDGNPDLVVVNAYSESLSVLLGNGDLTFQDAVALNLSEGSTPTAAVVADLSGDGTPDIASSNSLYIASSASFLDKVSVFVGQGNGDFAAPVDFVLPLNAEPWNLTAGDFNGDGIPDIGVADFTAPGAVSVLLNASQVALAGDIGTTDTSITLTSTTPLPESGTIKIDEEWIIYTGKQGNTLIVVARGANLTAPAAHAAGAVVTFIPSTGCVGDCGETGVVGVANILTAVDIALGNLPVYACQSGDANGDGRITVDEILSAVYNALNGCNI